ncbi:brefeldin a resistance protein [Ophiostoma piceae UAMH 11346]|uniref:Brefeldin a resistance protein n=1 Tax=Ophiostoma piceae (strain UAMH 11346) TaxID=1262450 RepID=S3CVZ8_OPHP1|nr:brefeldin a resistance protein [Ophiostoma piceae UAMH 11346]
MTEKDLEQGSAAAAEPAPSTSTASPDTSDPRYEHGKDEVEAAPRASVSSTSTATTVDLDNLREEARRSNPNGTSQAQSGVSVNNAVSEFAHLQQELSGRSRFSRVRSRADSNASRNHAAADNEKGAALDATIDNEAIEDGDASDDRFDLESYLRGSLAANQAAGIRPKHIGVYWDKLSVRGMGGSSNFVRTFPDAVVSFFDYITPLIRLLGRKPAGAQRTILGNFRGVCKPGEMVLVLGKPGSGCTTFLKTISNQRYGYTGVDGEVLYGPFGAAEFEHYRGECLYNQEDDVHHATLTVEQTLDFALDTKIAGKIPAGMTKKGFKAEVVDTMLKMFNIEHTRQTVVGGPFVRGVSGGEKKRVSIAEMLCTNACVVSFDNSTRGLDSSTALDFIKCLRAYCTLYRTTTFVSLYQASENIFSQFDKVLVIDGGRQAFFGPAQEARGYFERLGFESRPRQTTPDYLTGCTDEYERAYATGYSEKNAPHDPATLAEAFDKSSFAASLDEEMAAYKTTLPLEEEKYHDFRIAVKESKQWGAGSSVYAVPFHRQIWALIKRQFILKWQDKVSLSLAWLRTVIVAIVLATLYLRLPETTQSAFGKGGLMFISLLFNAFEAFAELSTVMLGRGVLNKHRAYAFHRPSALWLAQIIVDQAFAITRIFVFCVIVYFASNLYRSPAAFFTFFLMILSGNIGMTLFVRTVGCVSPDFDSANKAAVVIVTLFIITSGYLIQYQSEKVWLRWIYYINILGLSFSAMMENEFSRIKMTCSAETLIPSGAGYTDINHQVCTLPGSTYGTDIVSGTAYIEQSFSYSPGELWRNWGIVLAIIVFFLFLNVVCGELVRFGMGGNLALVYQRPNAERGELNKKLLEKREDRRQKKEDTAESDLSINSKSVLTWEALKYDVPVPGGDRRLLNEVFGYVKPGSLTALMGSSGAGKTTLLDVLASRKNIGVISPSRAVQIDGEKPGIEFQRSTSYAEQMDVHDPSQTVREAFRFSADLRQPFDTPRSEKYAYVEEIIGLLELEDLADCIIGLPEAGLTVEQRKRVTIGVELSAKPEMLLFLDEPTSGLDSQSAFNIVRFLRKLAAAGQAILCTIHQPNAALFDQFDRLLLLKSGGRCIYFGDIGADGVVLRDYFKRHGAVAKETDNVAEFMLEAIGAGSSPRIGNRDWADLWLESPEFAQVKAEIEEIKALRVAAVNQEKYGTADPNSLALTRTKSTGNGNVRTAPQKEYASPFWHQVRIVVHRTNVALYREANYQFSRLFNHVVIALLTGLTYLNLDDSRSSLQYKVFVMFQVTVLPALILSPIEVMYHIKRSIFFRESSSKMYSGPVFALAMLVAELPYAILCSVVFFLPLYYLPGLQSDSSRAGLQFFYILVTELFSITLGQGLAALTPSTFISSQFDPFIVITFALFCGVTISSASMPSFWRKWLYQLDPFTRLISGMVVTALHDIPVKCKLAELNVFQPPTNMKCEDYMGPFFDNGGYGYLDNPSSTADCGYCAYKTGDEFYTPLSMSFDNRWRDLGIYISFVASNIIIIFFAARYLNFNKR